MSRHTKRILFDIAGLACCLVPPCACTIAYFPLWRDTVGVTALCGGTLAVLGIVAFIVLGKYLRARFKTPSPCIMFGVLWGLFVLVEKTVTGLKTICFFGFVGGCVGAVLFMIADKYADGKGDG